VRASDLLDHGDEARARRAEAAVLALSDLHEALGQHGLRSGACSGDEMRHAASRLHSYLSCLGVGNGRAAAKPHADDPFALAADWAGPHVVPRRLTDYPLYGLPFAENELPVVSPRGVALLHATFLCNECADAHAAGSFSATCYIHTLAHMLMGVRCTWGPDGPPPPVVPALRPSTHADWTADEATWLDAEHDRMVAEGKSEALTAEQAADPAWCALIAPLRVAHKLSGTGDAPTSDHVPHVAAAAREAALDAAARILRSPHVVSPSMQAAAVTADLTTHHGTQKKPFCNGLSPHGEPFHASEGPYVLDSFRRRRRGAPRLHYAGVGRQGGVLPDADSPRPHEVLLL